LVFDEYLFGYCHSREGTRNNQIKLIAKNKLANVFGANQSMAFAA
jgi:hypothetical protein